MHRNKQSGFILVIGLALLTIATGMVVAGMSLGRHQERQAGNYVRANNAQIGADDAFQHFLKDDAEWVGYVKAMVREKLLTDDEGPDPRILNKSYFNTLPNNPPSPWNDRKIYASEGQYTRPMVERVDKIDNDTVRVTFSGRNLVDGNSSNVGFSSFKADFNVEGGDEPGGAYREVLLGCEGVSLSGSGRIDSYDSRKGAYDAQLENGEKNSGGTQGVVSTNDNEDENGNVTLSGSSPIYGQVRAAGSVTASGSASIHGDVKANKEIVIDSWSSRIEGNATAPVVRTTANRDVSEQVGGTINNTSPHVGAAASCDSFTKSEEATISDLIDALASYASSGSLSLGGGNQTYELTPDGLSNNNTVSDPKKDVTLDGIFPEPTNVLVLDSFSLNGSANFVVDGGDMTLYVKGNIDIGGGATFNVAEGSSLKIVTEGRFNLPSGLDIASDSVTNDEGNPVLSLYSTYDDGGASGWNAGVNITGSSTFKGTIFAPYSTVNVAGSGELFGAVKGRRVDISGSGDIHYDEALMESTIGTGGGESGGGGGDSWTLEGLSYGNAD